MKSHEDHKTIVEETSLVQFEIAREVALALERMGLKEKTKKMLQGLAGSLKPFVAMANEPATDKVVLSFQMGATDKRRLEKEAKKRGYESLSDFVRVLIYEAVKNVTLTPEDYEEIARQIRKNEARRMQKRIG